MFKILKLNAGFTLIELLVAATIALICTGAAMELYVSQQKGWLAQENITDMQQNGRAAIDELVFHIRQAGYHLPASLEAITSANSNPDSITVAYLADPICQATLTKAMTQPSSVLEFNPDSIGCFQENIWAYIYNPVALVGEFLQISNIDETEGKMTHSADLSRLYPLGSILYIVETVTFYLDNTTDSAHPRLMILRQDGVPQLYADNIDDLQFTYLLTYGSEVDTVVSSLLVRQVNISLVAKTERRDAILGEDCVRDTFETSIFLRNLSF